MQQSVDPPPRGWRWWLYRLVRPVMRPVAWRLRTFFVGHLRDEIAELRAETRALRDEIRQRDAIQADAVDHRILASMEQVLLTMALDREGR